MRRCAQAAPFTVFCFVLFCLLQVPVVLRARLAHLEVEFAQECRRRVAAEAALESMGAAMASEVLSLLLSLLALLALLVQTHLLYEHNRTDGADDSVTRQRH